MTEAFGLYLESVGCAVRGTVLIDQMALSGQWVQTFECGSRPSRCIDYSTILVVVVVQFLSVNCCRTTNHPCMKKFGHLSELFNI